MAVLGYQNADIQTGLGYTYNTNDNVICYAKSNMK